MKKYIVFLFIILFGVITKAQDEEVGWVSRFGIAVGINPAYVFPNLDEINKQVTKMGIEELNNSGFIMMGGSGYAYIMFVENLRIGAIGLGGSTSSSGKIGNYDKEVKYSLSLGGLTFEYTLPFIKNVAFSLGAIIGYGSSTIDIYQTSMNYTWENLWSKVTKDILITSEVSDKVTQSFLLFSPIINCDIPLKRFISFRIGGGYNITFNKNWKINNNRSISNVPSNLTANSFFIQTGIYFGFFAY
ncbi:MAG: hypothetical protein N2249_04550 [Melioribacter sp.]|nr:hypothetical protein [Melioribacter sp.]